MDELQFLGISDAFRQTDPAYPIGYIDVFKLRKLYPGVIYPLPVHNRVLVFWVKASFVKAHQELKFRLISQEGVTSFNFFSRIEVQETKKPDKVQIKKVKVGDPFSVISADWFFSIFPTNDLVIEKPGVYSVVLDLDGQIHSLGHIVFLFNEVPHLSPSQIEAIKANPYAVKKAQIHVACKNCESRMEIYTGLQRDEELEAKGGVWQLDLPENFECECKSTRIDLSYAKKNLHALLLNDSSTFINGVSIERKYAHEEILRAISEFRGLLDGSPKEEIVQKHLERNPVFFAKFHAKKIFHKPRILGKYVSDFVIHDATNRLIFVEIEKPSMRLFKNNNGHQTQDLTHAYSQIIDWFHEIQKHRNAVFDGLEIDPNKVSEVKGVLIAGRRGAEKLDHIFKHRSSNIYPHVEFLTYDDLMDTLYQISHDLA